MCELKLPFYEKDLTAIGTKIIKGEFTPISTTYSYNLRHLVDQLLSPTISRRPKINKILKYPLIRNRLKRFLNESQYKEEFVHTILHNETFLANPSQPYKNYSFDPNKRIVEEKKSKNYERIAQPTPEVPISIVTPKENDETYDALFTRIETAYGVELHKKIINKISEIDKRLKGTINHQEYRKELASLMTKEQIDNDLELFLKLFHMKRSLVK